MIDSHAPIVARKLSHKSYRREPWISPSLLRSINTQKKLYVKMLKPTKTTHNIMKYKRHKKILDKLKRTSKVWYYHTKCSEFKSNVKKTWELINQVIGKTSDKSSVISHIKADDLEVLNEKAIANEFGKYFSNVGKDLAKNVRNPKHSIMYYNNKIYRNSKSIYLHNLTGSETRKLIEKLPNKTSSRYNNINNMLLKKLCNSIALPLTQIFNLSIINGVFPSRMKLSETTPLHKGKETYLTNNYCPISLLLTISKLLEKLIYKRTYKFLNQINQFYNSQYGFRTSHSCEDSVCKLVGEVLKNKENGKFTAALFLDL